MRIAFVIPTYNEADNLPTLVARIFAATSDVEIVVVDDESPDGTGAIADEIAAREPRFHVIHRQGKRGYSPACKAGLAWCAAQGFDLIGTMDADLSHDPERIPALVDAVLAGASLAIGSRYVEGGGLVVDWGPFRKAVSRSGSRYARLMVGTSVNDCTSGFRLYRADELRAIGFESFQSEGYSFLIEVLAALRDRGAIVTEVPITYIDRRAGASKISKEIIAEAFVLTTGLGLARIIGRRRLTRS